MRLRVSVLLCLFLVCLTSISTAFSQNIGKPAGYIKLEVPAASQRLSSVPFIPFNSAINSVFANMLTGENNGDTADRIVKWDAATQSYVIAFKCAGSGDVSKDGKWFLYGSFTPSSMTFSPGEGFWIQNQHDLTQTVFLSGHIVLNDTMTVRLYPNLNLFAYPYTSRIALNSSDLKNDGAQGASEQAGNPDVLSKISPDASFWLKSLAGDVNDGKWMDSNNILTNESLKLGHSYWFNRRGNGAFDWTEVRPYANLFDTGSSSPQITDIAPNASGDGIVLSITGTGAAGEKLLILYKDMSENESLDTGSAWKTAAKDLSVAGGDAVVTWTDSNGIANTFIRLYVAARQDIDSDNDGVSDAEEHLVFGTNSTKADTDGDGISDAMEINTYHTNPLKTDTDGDGLSDSVELNTYHTDPLKVDTDNDGLSDKDEVAVYLTNPNLADTDGDGFSDAFEIQQKTNPNFKALATADGYKQELTVREDAEDGTIAGWSLYDNTPPGTIENVIDPDNSSNRCIKLTGTGTETGYMLTFQAPEKFQTRISWRMKYNEGYTIYISCNTNKGHRYIYYTGAGKHYLGTTEYVHHGLGSESFNGNWRVISRDLQKDLWEAQPDCEIISVNKFLIRGSGYIDDINTFIFADTDHDGIPYEREIELGTDPNKADTDNDNISDYDELYKYGTDPANADSDSDSISDLDEIGIYHTNPTSADSDKDGYSDRFEIDNKLNPNLAAIQMNGYKCELTVQDDAESSTVTGWTVYDNNPVGSIENVIDPDKSSNRCFKLTGGATGTGYMRTFTPSTNNQFKISWRMKYSESYTVYIDCTTIAGHRYIYYTNSKNNALGTDEYVHHGLGTDTTSDNWITFTRDLEKDLHDAQPENNIISVNKFLIRGSGYVDDITTFTFIDNDKDGIPDELELNVGLNPNAPSDASGDLDGDGLSNIEEFHLGTAINNQDSDGDALSDWIEFSKLKTNPLLKDSDGNGVNDGDEDSDHDGITNKAELDFGFDPLFPTKFANGYHYEEVIIENSESELIDWDVYDNDPDGTVENVIDPDNTANHCIKLSGGGIGTGFRKKFEQSEKSHFIIEWRMRYAEAYTVYISCQTNAGHRYIYYTNSSRNNLGTGEYVHHGLGTDSIDGKWHIYRKNLQMELNEAQPGVTIISVDAFLIRGSGYVDDIRMMSYKDSDGDLLADEYETAHGLNPNDHSDAALDSDGDGLSNLKELLYNCDPQNPDTNGDGISDGQSVATGIDPVLNTDPNADLDIDGLPDSWERNYFGNLTKTASDDPDMDGTNNIEEFKRGTSPVLKDVQDVNNSLKLKIFGF